jgi:cobalt/nickel transport system permease protein
MIEDLYFIEKQAYRSSFIHQLDSRVKIILTFAFIFTMVAFPYSPEILWLGSYFLIFLIILWLLSGLSPLLYLKRLLLILPFGMFIIIFQIFFTNPYYSVFHPLITLPLGIIVYAESLEFASILFAKFIVCVSFIILLSSTTKMQDLLEGAGRLGLPAEFTLCLGMMVRYLFVFAGMIVKIRNALETRCFDPFDPSLPYRYRLRQMGYTIGMMFIRSYEQGERTYTSMLCRGYGVNSHLYIGKKRLSTLEWTFLTFSIVFVLAAAVGTFIRI